MAKFVLSKSKLLEQYESVKNKVDIVSYSLKTNKVVGRVLEESTDCWMSVHFAKALEEIKDCSRVLFFGQGWSSSEVLSLLRLGVDKFVVDNENDLRVLLDTLRENDYKITLFLRMRMKENTIHTGKHFVFGFKASDVNRVVEEIKENSCVRDIGIHFHRKTQNIHEWNMKYELEDSLSQSTLEGITYLNIGGGMPVTYRNSRANLDHIYDEIRKLREWLGTFDIQIIAEPGRLLAAPCIKLVAMIKNVYEGNVILDCSVYNAAMDTFIAHVRLELENESEEGEAFTVKGCTPDSLDIFRYRVFLKNPKVGDELVFVHAGAYNFNSNFCNLDTLPTEIID